MWGYWEITSLLELERAAVLLCVFNNGFNLSVWPADTKDILVMLSDMDINAIAGTLKLYFRELPEPLLTDRLYPAFMEGIGVWPLVCVCHQRALLEFYQQVPFAHLEDMRAKVKKLPGHNWIWHLFSLSLAALSDPAAKENCMMHLLRSLPDPNLMTFLTLLEHLKRYTHTHTHLLTTVRPPVS